jgi:hypothetical protein
MFAKFSNLVSLSHVVYGVVESEGGYVSPFMGFRRA